MFVVPKQKYGASFDVIFRRLISEFFYATCTVIFHKAVL